MCFVGGGNRRTLGTGTYGFPLTNAKISLKIIIVKKKMLKIIYIISHSCWIYMRQIGGFLKVLRFPPPTKHMHRHDLAEILLKVTLSTIKPNQT
jgi:hypothetical protein